MGNAWIEALKEYNKGHNKWCVVKKGTSEYNEVKKIMERKSAPKSKESEPAGKPRQLGPYEWQIYYGQTAEQKRLSNKWIESKCGWKGTRSVTPPGTPNRA